MADKEHLKPKSVQQPYADTYYPLPDSQVFYGPYPPSHFTWMYNPFTPFQPYNPYQPLYPAAQTSGAVVGGQGDGSSCPAGGRPQLGGMPPVAAGTSQGEGTVETRGQWFGISAAADQTSPQSRSEGQTWTKVADSPVTSQSVPEERGDSDSESPQDMGVGLYGDVRQQLHQVQGVSMVSSAVETHQTRRGVGSQEGESEDATKKSAVKRHSYDSWCAAAGLTGGYSPCWGGSGEDSRQTGKERQAPSAADLLSERLSHLAMPRDARSWHGAGVVYVSPEQMQVFNDELLAARHQLEEYKQKYNSAVEEQGQYKKLMSDLSQQITEKENENEVLKIQVQILKEDFDLEKEAKESTDCYYRDRLKEEKEKRKQLEEQMSPHRRDRSFSHLVNSAAVTLTPSLYHKQGNPAGGACYHDVSTGRTCINTPSGNVTVTPSGVTISDCKYCYEYGESSDGKHNVNIIINHPGSTPRTDQNHFRSQSETNLQRVSSFEFPSDVVTDGENEE